MNTDTMANCFNCRTPLSNAVSPPTMVVMATTGDKATKCQVYWALEKAKRLNSGLMVMHSNMPNTAANRLHTRTICTT